MDDDLLKKIVEVSRGSARRVVVNLAKVEELAQETGMQQVSMEDWGTRAFFTGDAPTRRI